MPHEATLLAKPNVETGIACQMFGNGASGAHPIPPALSRSASNCAASPNELDKYQLRSETLRALSLAKRRRDLPIYTTCMERLDIFKLVPAVILKLRALLNYG